MFDAVTFSVVVASAFFVVLSLGLIWRYMQVSRSIEKSNDLGRDLWRALEERLKKQDERIVDVMARLEVTQLRVKQAAVRSPLGSPPASAPSQVSGSEEADAGEVRHRSASRDAMLHGVTDETAHQVGYERGLVSLVERQQSQLDHLSEQLAHLQSLLQLPTQEPASKEDATHPANVERTGQRDAATHTLLAVLSERALTSVEVRQRFAISREHAARILKVLFDDGLVTRNDSKKPFVYELTEAGRNALGSRRSQQPGS